ncbi:MAG: TonB-dependent receptor [Myxococcales bacterium]|nr:TonB-dependent receptor [Myxococcales bacterium]
MKTIIKSFMAAALLVGGGSLIEAPVAHAQGATVGSLRGAIRDKATGEAAVGATVVATSPSLQGEQVVITEDGGQYFITSLPPGNYVLTVYYNDATFSRGNVVIQVGKEAVVNVTVDSAASTGKPKGEVIEIKGTAPIVDQGSTKTGMTIGDDYTRNIPTGRTFGAVVGQAAGAQSDNYGISFAGATSGENTYIVEGINTTDTGFGGIASNLPNEFISETEVITGGYNAEYGRATGGIVNVVTKQGSNEFRGSVFSYVQPGTLISDAKTIQREGGSIDSQNNLDYRYDIGAELGGPILKDKLWFHVGFNPSISHYTAQRLVQTQVDDNGDGVPDVDPNTGFTVHKEIASSDIPQDFKTYFFTAKVNGAVNQNNQFQVSFFGNPRSAQDVFTITRNPAQTRWKYDDGAYDVAGKWTSKFNKGATQLDAVLGYHRGFTTEKPFNSSQNVPTIFYNYERSLSDFADLEGSQISACDDTSPNDPYPMIRNCPVTAYTEQGLSLLEKKVNDRTSAAISLTHRQKLGPTGFHVFKAGVDVEFAGYSSNTAYSGGARYRRSANTATGAPGRWQLREFFKFSRNLTTEEAMDPSAVALTQGQSLCANDQAICERADQLNADTNNRNIGAYLQDTWQIKPNLTLNAGIRWEQQIGYASDQLAGTTTPEGEVVPDEAYKLNNLLAPRIGFIFDPTKEGKSKLFGHYGRFYENVPMDLNVRAFGGEITNFTSINQSRFTPTNGGYDPNCDVDHGSTDIVKKLDMCQDRLQQAILGGGIEFVSPGMKGQRTDEIILGAEYEFMADFKAGATFQHRTLPIVIEDISVDGGNNYLITNPGQNFDGEADKLLAQAMKLQASSDPKEVALGDLYASRANQMYYVKNLEKPVRNYDALQLTVTQRPTKASLLMASYTFSQSKGNYPGLFSTETGQNDPNITSLYDLPDLMANRYGPLGLDRPHNVKVDGFYQFDLKTAGVLTAGGSFRAQSGIAHNVLGASQHPGYGSGESYLLPRGAATRSPVTSQLDIRVAYGYKINKHTMLEGFVNVFNLFNQQDQLNVDENYTQDFVNPILGGDPEDLKHVKTLDEVSGAEINASPIKNKNYNHTGTSNATITGAQQAPRAVQLGFRLTF